MSEENPQAWAGNWLGYREEIKVIDVTIRDGGLMNDHKFDDKVVKAVYEACVEAGIDYMEIGYINSREQFPPGEFGPWKHSHEDDIRRIVGDNDTPLKLAGILMEPPPSLPVASVKVPSRCSSRRMDALTDSASPGSGVAF